MTHTQGPWGVNDLAANNANIYLTGLDGTKSPLGYIVQTATAPIAAMIKNKADARLIAAAPDLLAVVCEMLGAAEVDLLDETSNVWRSAMISARAAIAKAEGN